MEKGKAKLSSVIRTRVTDEIYGMIHAQAQRAHTDPASVIREIISSHYENEFSDKEIITHNIISLKREVKMLENKLEVMSLILLELSKSYASTFPRRHITKETAEKFYEEFITEVSENMKNHKGMLESIVLDIYERQGGAV